MLIHRTRRHWRINRSHDWFRFRFWFRFWFRFRLWFRLWLWLWLWLHRRKQRLRVGLFSLLFLLCVFGAGARVVTGHGLNLEGRYGGSYGVFAGGFAVI
ncbi:MAG TPA: hypothetical protein QGH10_01205, partial [Armatimonadota bacterium]|nr:hypothetical protein [Armatimonadota bacterium]